MMDGAHLVIESALAPLVAHIEVVLLFVLRSGVQSNDGCAAWKCISSRAVYVSSWSCVCKKCLSRVLDVVHGDIQMSKCVPDVHLRDFHAGGVTSHLWGRLVQGCSLGVVCFFSTTSLVRNNEAGGTYIEDGGAAAVGVAAATIPALELLL